MLGEFAFNFVTLRTLSPYNNLTRSQEKLENKMLRLSGRLVAEGSLLVKKIERTKG